MKRPDTGPDAQDASGVGSRARRKAERPEQILEAAFEEFVLKGYSATRVEDVAARIRVTKGTIYFYFGSKELLFERAIQVIGSAPLAKFLQDAAPWTDDVVVDLKTYLGALYRFIANNPRSTETLRLLLAECKTFPDLVDAFFQNWMDPVAIRLNERLEKAAADGQIRASTTHLVELILAPAFGHYMMQVLFSHREGTRNWDSDILFQAQLDLLFGGLLPIAVA